MKKENIRRVASILVNLVIVIWTVQSILQFFVNVRGALLGVAGVTCFRYFTIDSNILCALSALVMLIFQLRSLCAGKPLPQSVLLLKFAGTVTVLLTFSTVVLFLGPTQGYVKMFSGNGFYLHLVGPVLAAVSLFGLEKGEAPVSKKQMLFGFLPVVIYGAVYLTEVIFIGAENGGWPDFYGFKLGGLWYISLVVMMAAALALCALSRLCHNRVQWGGRKGSC